MDFIGTRNFFLCVLFWNVRQKDERGFCCLGQEEENSGTGEEITSLRKGVCVSHLGTQMTGVL